MNNFDWLYENEINWTISSFWDSGYTVQLGDSINGYSDESEMISTYEEAIEELNRLANKRYPGIFDK